MKAVAYSIRSSIDHENSLIDAEFPQPNATETGFLVGPAAILVKPAGTRNRENAALEGG